MIPIRRLRVRSVRGVLPQPHTRRDIAGEARAARPRPARDRIRISGAGRPDERRRRSVGAPTHRHGSARWVSVTAGLSPALTGGPSTKIRISVLLLAKLGSFSLSSKARDVFSITSCGASNFSVAAVALVLSNKKNPRNK